MMKNDYRREMILLRPLEEGISGFCRIETHVSRGSIAYNIRTSRTFGAQLFAVLVGARNGRWQAAVGGVIRSGALGQAGYYWEIDPRAIDGLTLENYALVGVAVAGTDAHLLLAGKQDKSKQVDWDAANQAVRDALIGNAETSAYERQTAPDPAQQYDAQSSETLNSPQAASAPECACADFEMCVDAQTQETAAENEYEPNDTPLNDTVQTLDECCIGLTPCVENETEIQAAEDDVASPDDIPENGPGAQNAAGARTRTESGEAAVQMDDACLRAERSHIIRVLGASVLGEKDSDLSDEQLGGLIENALRDMLSKLEQCKSANASYTTETDAESTENAQAQEAAASDTELPDVPDIKAEMPLTVDETDLASDTMPTDAPNDTQGALSGAASSMQYEDEQIAALLDEAVQTEYADKQASPGANDTRPWLLAGRSAQERAWPTNCAELKRLFINAVRAYPIDAPGFVFVRAPMAGGGDCAVGVKCEDGLPAEVMYLIPGRFSAEPPAGLEGYVWREGAGGGFWMARQDAYTGAMLFDE